MTGLERLWHVRGSVRLYEVADPAPVIARLAERLRRAGCELAATPHGLHLSSGTAARYSLLALIDSGDIALEQAGGETCLRYSLSTAANLRLCAILSLVVLAWVTLGEPWLTVFGFTAPLVWLYGANFALCHMRIPGGLQNLCMAP